MKEVLLEKIEDKIDLQSISEYENRLMNDEVEFYTLEETKEMLDL